MLIQWQSFNKCHHNHKQELGDITTAVIILGGNKDTDEKDSKHIQPMLLLPSARNLKRK